MSSRLGTYISIASISTFDFCLGTAIAQTCDYIFPAPTETMSVTRLFLTSIAQLITAITLSHELRSLLISEKGFFDPTGGICFIMSLNAMPEFWKRNNILVTKVLDYIFNPRKQDPTASGPLGNGSETPVQPTLETPSNGDSIQSQIAKSMSRK